MTEDELNLAERELGIRLPGEYRRHMQERHEEMASKTLVTWQGRVSFFHKCLYQVADKLISNNLSERRPGRGPADLFSGWEQKNVLVGHMRLLPAGEPKRRGQRQIFPLE